MSLITIYTISCRWILLLYEYLAFAPGLRRWTNADEGDLTPSFECTIFSTT